MLFYDLNKLSLPNRQGVQVFDFPFDISTMNVTMRTLTERYPEHSYVQNNESHMVVVVLSGTVFLYRKGEEGVSLTKDMIVHVPTKSPYYWIPDPKASLLIFSSKNWHPGQQELIPG